MPKYIDLDDFQRVYVLFFFPPYYSQSSHMPRSVLIRHAIVFHQCGNGYKQMTVWRQRKVEAQRLDAFIDVVLSWDWMPQCQAPAILPTVECVGSS